MGINFGMVRELPRDQVSPELAEQWVRWSLDEWAAVDACKWADEDPSHAWEVNFSAAEHVREEPLISLFHQRIEEELTAVPGVVRVREEDRGTWLIEGLPSGQALATAAAAVMDELSEQIRACLS